MSWDTGELLGTGGFSFNGRQRRKPPPQRPPFCPLSPELDSCCGRHVCLSRFIPQCDGVRAGALGRGLVPPRGKGPSWLPQARCWPGPCRRGRGVLRALPVFRPLGRSPSRSLGPCRPGRAGGSTKLSTCPERSQRAAARGARGVFIAAPGATLVAKRLVDRRPENLPQAELPGHHRFPPPAAAAVSSNQCTRQTRAPLFSVHSGWARGLDVG